MKTKSFVLLTVLFMAISLSLSAQKKKNDKETIVYDVSMTCDNCKKRIEKNIAFEKGVTDLIVNLPAKTVYIEYQAGKTDSLKLKSAIEKLGYTATVHTGK